MASIRTVNSDINHAAAIVQAELEPFVLAEIVGDTMRASSVIVVVGVIVATLADGMMSNVCLPVNIWCFDNPSVVRR